VKLVVPLASPAVSRMLPLLVSVKVTEPAGVPAGALTLAVNVTRESYLLEAEDEVSVVDVAEATDFASGAAAAATGKRGLVAAAMLMPAAATLTPMRIR